MKKLSLDMHKIKGCRCYKIRLWKLVERIDVRIHETLPESHLQSSEDLEEED